MSGSEFNPTIQIILSTPTLGSTDPPHPILNPADVPNPWPPYVPETDSSLSYTVNFQNMTTQAVRIFLQSEDGTVAADPSVVASPFDAANPGATTAILNVLASALSGASQMFICVRWNDSPETHGGAIDCAACFQAHAAGVGHHTIPILVGSLGN